MNAAGLLLLAVPLTPLLLMPAWLLPWGRRWGWQLLPWLPLPAVAAALLVPAGITQTLPALLLGAEWGMHPLARPFLLVTALVWLAAGLFARSYLRDDPHRDRFGLLWLATLAGNLGLILAIDIASFYTFFGLMTFAAYGLVVHDGSRRARQAGRVYLTMALLGEVLLLAGLLLAAGQQPQPLLSGIPAVIAGGDHAHLITGTLLAGFGIKAGLPLLHMWLPLAHPAAPAPASAVLSGAMIKAGLLGWLWVLPLGADPMLGWGALLLALGVLGAFGGAVIGVLQRQPKAVLAYSSISQMGVMSLLLGVGLLLPAQWSSVLPALLLFAVHHGVAKAALFLGAGLAGHAGGLPRWLLLTGWLLPGLALAGAPLSGGALVKGLAKYALHADQPAWLATVLALLSLTSVATAALMARYCWLQRQLCDMRHRQAALWPGWLLLVLLTLTAPLWLLWLLPESSPPPELDGATLWAALWPLLPVAAATALLLRGGWRTPVLPPGDLLLLLLPPLRLLRRLLHLGARRVARLRNNGRALIGARGDGLMAAAERLRGAEELALRHGGHALVLLLLLLSLLLLL